MKLISFILIIALAGIFIISLNNSIHLFSLVNNAKFTAGNDLLAFDPALSQHRGFTELEEKISAKIAGYKNSVHQYSTWSIALNLTVTVITGLCALITTISTIKKNSVTKAAAISIAIITFAATLLSAVQGQLNTSKAEVESKWKKITDIRNELEALKPDELNTQIPIINRRINEEL